MIYNLDQEHTDLFTDSSKWTKYDEEKLSRAKKINREIEENKCRFEKECFPFFKELGIDIKKGKYDRTYNICYKGFEVEDYTGNTEIDIRTFGEEDIANIKNGAVKLVEKFHKKDTLKKQPKSIVIIASNKYGIKLPKLKLVYSDGDFSIVSSTKTYYYDLNTELEELLKHNEFIEVYKYLSDNKKCFWQLNLLKRKHNFVLDEVKNIVKALTK